LMNLKTESSTSLRYRDDIQICTTNVYYGQSGGLALVPGSYHVFGNNGTTPYSGRVDSGNSALTNLAADSAIPAGELYGDLTTATDHLPMVADYSVPVPPPPPTAAFSATPTNGVAALTVTFTDGSSGLVTNLFWAFGDGSITNSAANAVTHVYSAAGSYSVTEVVTGPGGASTNVADSYITVQAGVLPAPQIQLSAGSLLMSWALPTISYRLLSAPSPTGPWAPEPAALSTNGGMVTVLVDATNSQRFYRLQGE